MLNWLENKDAVILLNDFIDINKRIDEQIWSLKEDLLQLGFYNKKIIIDVGWTNEFELNGCFKILVIKDLDWDNPLKTQNVDDVGALIALINDVANHITQTPMPQKYQ